MRRLVCLFIVVAAGCGNITRKADDGGPRDAPPTTDATDAPKPLIDAGSGARPLDAFVVAPQSREIVSGGATMSGATYSMDVQVGNAIWQAPVAGATYTLEGNASVKP